MPKQPSSKKNLFIILGIIVVGALVYFYMSGNSDINISSLDEEMNPEADIASSQVLGLLNQIQSLRIDPAIFSKPAYRTLRDYTVSIPPQNVGRQNPFAPIAGVSTTVSENR